MPDAPDWLWEAYDEADQATISAWLDVLRARARPRLLQVDEDDRRRYAKVITGPGESLGARGGFARIVQRGRYLPLVGEEGGGTYYSFREGKHTWSGGQLGVDGGRLWGPFAGNLLLDLGDLKFAELRQVVAGEKPDSLATQAELADAWDLLWSPLRSGASGVSETVEQRIAELRLGQPRPAGLGHSYLYRNTQSRDGDELVLVTVLASDDVGVSFAWRILKSFPIR